jgi:hypothetical protein
MLALVLWFVIARGLTTTLGPGQNLGGTFVFGNLVVEKDAVLVVSQGFPVSVTGNVTLQQGSVLSVFISTVTSPLVVLTGAVVIGSFSQVLAAATCDPNNVLVNVAKVLYVNDSVALSYTMSSQCVANPPNLIAAAVIGSVFAAIILLIGIALLVRRYRTMKPDRDYHTLLETAKEYQ